MVKKTEHFSTAEDMYVVQLHTYQTIANTLNISTRTLNNWNKAGGWDKKRAELIKQRRSLTDRLESVCDNLLELIEKDISKGKKPSKKILSEVRGLYKDLTRPQIFKQKEKEKPVEVKKSKDLSDEAKKMLNDKLGLDL